jgi:Fe-S oxidoreductase
MPDRRAEIESIQKRIWVLDEFILRVATVESSSLLSDVLEKVRGQSSQRKISFHPHCHQRAEGLADDGLPTGSAATVEMLRAFGFDVDVIDAGCCGMAGTFGYDAEHYDLSMQVGELKLLPKVRELGMGNGKLASSGSACRLQIKQGAGVDAAHPLVMVAECLNSKVSN